jgi:AcrR family transcriptional regulator
MPKIVDKASRRKEIAYIAMRLFAHRGYEKTSIREITSEAGMGKGTFYDYFKDKEDILNEIVHLLFAEWTGILVEKLTNIKDPIAQLSVLLKEGAKLGDRFEQLMITYIDIWRRSVSQKEGGEFIKSFQYFLLNSKKAIADIIEKAKVQGKIRKDIDSSVIATVLLALIDGFCLHHMILRPNMDVDTISDSFFNTLMNGMK